MSTGTDEIRQIQMMMTLFLFASTQGKLREFFDAALKASASQAETKLSPCTDTSSDGLKAWLESLLAQGGLSAEEQTLVDWQNNSDNMSAAVNELNSLQDKLGFKFSVQSKS